MNTYLRLVSNILVICYCIAGTSCNRNRLKTDEKKLIQSIQLDESKKEQITKEEQQSDVATEFSTSLRYHEDRSVDKGHPPIIIDIAGNLSNMRDLKLSGVASNIKYIRMETLPDSSLQHETKFKYYLMDSFIVAINYYGTHLYSKKGKYIRTIVKNEFTGIDVGIDMITTRNDHIFKGGGISVCSRGNRLFYIYSNIITGQEYIMECNFSKIQLPPDNRFDPEHPDKISGLGEIFVDLNQGKRLPLPSKRQGRGMWIASLEDLYGNMSIFLLDKNVYAKRLSGKYMMGIFNKAGDTISTFTKFEQLNNYSKTLARGTDTDVQYEYNGKLFFRNAFNDTVFLVKPPNRLLPIYVISLGSYKVTKQQGVDPGFVLTGKIIPGSWAENRNYVFLTFTKDNYDCPRNRINKKVKIYHTLYSKTSHQLYIIKDNPLDYSNHILENDLDGGLSVWPMSYMIDNNSDILISVKGSELKAHVRSEKFKKANVSDAKKNKLKQFVDSITDSDDILMIVQ